MRFSGLLCGIRAKICSEKTWLKFVAMSAFNIPSPLPPSPGRGRSQGCRPWPAGGFAPQPRLRLLCGINGGFAPQPRLVSTVCLTYKINYSIIRGKMQVKFSGENHGFLWQNVKWWYAFTTQRKNAKISIALLRIRKELRLWKKYR